VEHSLKKKGFLLSDPTYTFIEEPHSFFKNVNYNHWNGGEKKYKKTSIQKIKNSPKKGMINKLLTRKRLGN
jgi:hypothetical protein